MNPLEYFSNRIEKNVVKEGVLSIFLYKNKSAQIPLNRVTQKFKENLNKSELKHFIGYFKNSLVIEKDKFKPGVHISCEKFDMILLKHHLSSNSLGSTSRSHSISKYVSFKKLDQFLEAKDLHAKSQYMYFVENNLEIEKKKFSDEDYHITSNLHSVNEAQKIIKKNWNRYLISKKLSYLMEAIHRRRNETYSIPVIAMSKLDSFLKNYDFKKNSENIARRKEVLSAEATPSLFSSPFVFEETKPFYKTFKLFNNMQYELAFFYQETYKVISIDIIKKKGFCKKL